MVKTLQNKGLAVFVLLCVIFNFSCKQEVKQELVEEEEVPLGIILKNIDRNIILHQKKNG